MDYFVIGERELVLAFALVGVQGASALNRTEALDAFNMATGKGSAILGAPVTEKTPRVLIITEEVALFLEEEVINWQKKGAYPLIVEIPSLKGRIEGKKTLSESIREAIGISV